MSKYLIERNQIKEKTKYGIDVLLGIALFIYIVCAYLFEWSPITARYSTIAVYALFLLGIAYILMSKEIMLNIYTGSIVILCAYIYIMTQVGESNGRAYENAYDYLTCSILCYIVCYTTRLSGKMPQYLLWGIIAGAFLLSLRLISSYGGVESMIELGSKTKEFRIGGSLINSNILGTYMATAILCIFIILLINNKNNLTKICLFICVALFAFMLLMSASKKALFFFVFITLAIAIYRMRNSNWIKSLLIFTGVIIFAVVFYRILLSVPAFHTIGVRINNLVSTITTGNSDTNTDAVRVDMIRIGWNEFLNSPIFGNGSGHSFTMFGTYSHNNFIEMLMNYGLIGFLLYYVPYLFLIPQLFMLVKKKDIIAAYFLFYSIFHIILSVGWVVYYERVVQINTASAWGYVMYNRDKKLLDLDKKMEGDGLL